MEKIKKIKGAQPPLPPLPSNNAGLNVIRACKVYDWVVSTGFEQQDVVIPGTVGDTTTPLGVIAAAVAAGQTVSIQCAAPTVPAGVFPLAPGTCGASSESPVAFPTGILGQCYPPTPYPPYPPCPDTPACTGVIVARNVPIPGRPGVTGAIVKLIQRIPITFNVFTGTGCLTAANCNLCPVTSFICNIQARTQVVVCLPDLLDERNINCRAFNLTCNTSGLVFNGNTIDVEISVCTEVQVEAEVKLEIDAKFAQPRPIIPIPPAAACPPVVEFPPACDFFPIPNCTCQGNIAAANDPATITETTGGVTTTTTGFSRIDAAICPECNPAGSFVNYFFDPATYATGPFVITFKADALDPVGTPTCVTTGVGTAAVTTLTVGGTGLLTIDGIPYPFTPFTLVLTTTGAGVCSYRLVINAALGTPTIPINPAIPAIDTGVTIVPCSQITIRDCTTLPINTVPVVPPTV